MIKELYIDSFTFKPLQRDYSDEFQNLICEVFNNKIKTILFDLHEFNNFVDFICVDNYLVCVDNYLVCSYKNKADWLIVPDQSIFDKESRTNPDAANIFKDILGFNIKSIF